MVALILFTLKEFHFRYVGQGRTQENDEFRGNPIGYQIHEKYIKSAKHSPIFAKDGVGKAT